MQSREEERESCLPGFWRRITASETAGQGRWSESV